MSLLRKCCAVVSLLVLGAAAARAGDLSLHIPVEKYRLTNGLTVLLVEDRAVPLVSYHTWYKVGSRDEHEGITGSAHMLEHMMFQGAKKYTGKQFQRLMDENGIEFNAFTTYDYTGFHMNLPPSKLETVMEAEVDRMSSLALDPKNLESEHRVVMEERRWRVENSPFGLLGELMMSTVFKQSPYHWPVIGWMKDIKKFTVSDLRQFYETYYVPSNAVLVIAGDFDRSRTKSLIEKYYGPLPTKPEPARQPATEPNQTSPRGAHLARNVQVVSFEIAFRTVPEHDPDMYALDLAAVALGSGSASRLYRDLVYERQIAAGVSTGNSSMQQSGLFSIGVTLKPGASADEVMNVITAQLRRLKRQPISDEELRKVRTLKLKSYVDGLRTVEAKAQALAAAEILTGSYENLLGDMERYEKVTAADIQRVAVKYFTPSQRTDVMLRPLAENAPAAPLADSAKEAPAGGGR